MLKRNDPHSSGPIYKLNWMMMVDDLGSSTLNKLFVMVGINVNRSMHGFSDVPQFPQKNIYFSFHFNIVANKACNPLVTLQYTTIIKNVYACLFYTLK